MKAIACITKNNGIGLNGNLLVKSKKDMYFFRKMTIGKIVVMGRKTFESLGSKPLKDRVNVVISSTNLDNKEIVQFNNLDDFLRSKYNNEDTFVIGGYQIYKQLLPYVNILYLTEVDIIKEADTFFPDFECEFTLVSVENCIDNDLKLKFCKYIRKR